jgi:hypothetical protein
VIKVVNFALAVTVAAPTTPDTDVAAARFGLPDIGDPGVGDVPLNAMLNDPEGVENTLLILLLEPLLNTLKVG